MARRRRRRRVKARYRSNAARRRRPASRRRKMTTRKRRTTRKGMRTLSGRRAYSPARRKRRKPARKRRAVSRRRRRNPRRKKSAATLVRSARRRITGAKGRRGLRYASGDISRRLGKVEKDLKSASTRLKRRRRKNPARRRNAATKPLHLVGFGLGGFVAEQLIAGGLRKAFEKKISEAGDQQDTWIKAIEIGTPAAGSALAWFAPDWFKVKALKDKNKRIAIIAGMWGGWAARNVEAITAALIKVPGLRQLAVMGQEDSLKGKAAEAFAEISAKAGASGFGRYVTSGSLGRYDYEDDLYAGQAGVGRYMLDDTAFRGAGMDGLGGGQMYAGAAGVGEYVSVPPTMDGLSGAVDSEYDEIIDELGAVPQLTPDEEQAENILVPQLAYEALQGLHGPADSAMTIKASMPNAKIIRTTPGMAAKVESFNIGQVIGESRQVPGTVLVASSVAGRDVIQGAGPFIPSQKTAFKNPAIQPAGNVEVSPYGVFSAGVFSSTLPVHGQISR